MLWKIYRSGAVQNTFERINESLINDRLSPGYTCAHEAHTREQQHIKCELVEIRRELYEVDQSVDLLSCANIMQTLAYSKWMPNSIHNDSGRMWNATTRSPPAIIMWLWNSFSH